MWAHPVCSDGDVISIRLCNYLGQDTVPNSCRPVYYYHQFLGAHVHTEYSGKKPTRQVKRVMTLAVKV